jgi:MFS family permease
MSSRRWLFVGSCIALITSAFTFSVRGDIMQEMGNAFQFTQEQKGQIEGDVFLGMALSMLFGGFICDLLGMKRIMYLALLSHLFGTLGTIFAARLSGSLESVIGAHENITYYWLRSVSLLMGCGNGFTEVAINPLIATLFKDKKTHFLNILHAWWPGGLVIGGLSASLGIRALYRPPATGVFGLQLWQASLCLIVIPAVIYGLMLIPAQFPKTERVASGVSTGAMFKECFRPMFLLWGVCMLMTAATELGPQKWQNSVMEGTAHVSGTMILVYTSGMMFVLRHFAGPIAHRISPVGLMAVSSLFAGIGLYLLSFADSAFTAFGFATVYGLGIAYFWPTMLGVTAERFPKGGALALALMGSVGNLSISQVTPLMGRIVDTYAVSYVEAKGTPSIADEVLKKNDQGEPIAVNVDAIKKYPEESPQAEIANAAQADGYRWAFRWVALMPVALVVLFSGIFLYDRSRGGYKPEILIGRKEESELLSGGVQGPVE